MTGERVAGMLCQAARTLRAAAIEAPRQEARILLAHAMGTAPEALLRDPQAIVPHEACRRFHAVLTQRSAHIPMARILGEVGFWTLDLEVGPQTLIPRADSETLIEAAIEAALALGLTPGRILDLGTGTGCLLLAALSAFPAANGFGVDINPGAAALASRNALRNGLGARACFLAGCWADALESRFDLILANPPYIESAAIADLMPEVSLHEPGSALDGGPDGLVAYRDIMVDLSRLLSPVGIAVLELGQGQAVSVSALTAGQGLEVVGLRSDLGGVARALILKLSQKPVGGMRSCV